MVTTRMGCDVMRCDEPNTAIAAAAYSHGLPFSGVGVGFRQNASCAATVSRHT